MSNASIEQGDETLKYAGQGKSVLSWEAEYAIPKSTSVSGNMIRNRQTWYIRVRMAALPANQENRRIRPRRRTGRLEGGSCGYALGGIAGGDRG